jgi:predicted RNA methylase
MLNLAPNPPPSKANAYAAAPQASLPYAQVSVGTQTLAALGDHPDADDLLDQYYTRPQIATHCYEAFVDRFDPRRYRIVEPSAGTGSFMCLLPPGSLGYDLAPRHPAIMQADFLTLKIRVDKPLAFIGNPPFGKNASLAVRFFNRAAMQGDVVAFILPRSFRKASIQNRLNRDFHLVYDEILPADAFEFKGVPYDVPTIFQIWERRAVERSLWHVETRHPDFEFTTSDHAHFAIQRVGANAGRIHCNFEASPNAHYFIRAVSSPPHVLRQTMARLNLAGAASNVAGNPSLAKSEIVALYRSR